MLNIISLTTVKPTQTTNKIKNLRKPKNNRITIIEHT